MKGIKANVIDELRSMGIRKAEKSGIGLVPLRQMKTDALCRILYEERLKRNV